MMTTAMKVGIDRKIDGLGRIVIPAEIRQSFRLRAGDALTIEVRGGTIVLRPIGDPCPTCGIPQR